MKPIIFRYRIPIVCGNWRIIFFKKKINLEFRIIKKINLIELGAASKFGNGYCTAYGTVGYY